MPVSKFAVIKTGGKQYKVEKGLKLKVEKLLQKEGSEVIFKDVLLYVDGATVEVGAPRVSATVTGKVLEHGKAKKVVVYKYKRRKRESTKKGHRQQFTKVEILEVKEVAISRKSTITKLAKKAVTKKLPAKKTGIKK